MVMTAMRRCFVAVLAFGTASWQPRSLPDQSSAASFLTGTYTSCAQGAHNPSGNVFLNVAGFQDGARLTLAQSGSTVVSTLVDQNGLKQSLRFSAATRTLATITRKGQSIPGFRSLCVQGPGRWAGYPASLSVNAGALTYNAGMVFLTLTGDLRSDAGACGALSQPQASFWLACGDRPGGLAASTDAGSAPAAPVAQLPVGEYRCSTQVETLGHSNGRNEYATDGASGTLMLTEDGAKVTARYSGDTSLAGTLRFTATTSTTARAEAGQNLMAPCMFPVGSGRPSPTPEPVPIVAGSLTMIDSMLFLSFAGTMADRSSCPGTHVAGSIICSK
jgi:hypothetical protein